MTEQERQALRAYLDKPDNAQWEHNGETRSLAEWIAVRDDAAVAGALSSEALGASLGKVVPRVQVPANEVKSAIAKGAEFATMPESTMTKLNFFITTDPFPMADADMVAGVETILGAFEDTKARFGALRQRPGSIAESLIGRPVSVNEVSEALNA